MRAIVDAVQTVTHIAPPDDDGQIIGEPLAQHGSIYYPYKPLGLCGGVTNALYTATTEGTHAASPTYLPCISHASPMDLPALHDLP